MADEEKRRLAEDEKRERNWKRWGPYLSERQWGTVRDDQEARVELVRKRQSLYESKTLQMSGKTRGMLKGYRTDNSKSDSPKPAYSYTPDPTTRYNDPIFASETRYVDSIRCSVRAE